MDITPPIALDVNFINGYSRNGLKINNQILTEDIILSAKLLIKWENQEGIFTLGSYNQIINISNIPELKINNKIILI